MINHFWPDFLRFKLFEPKILEVFKSNSQFLSICACLLTVLPAQAFQTITPALPYRSATLKQLPKALPKGKKIQDKIEIIYPQFYGGSKAATDLNGQLMALFTTKAEEMIQNIEETKNAQGMHFLSGEFKVHFNRYNFVAFEMHLYTQHPNKEMLDEKVYYFSYNVSQAKKPTFQEVFAVSDSQAWQNKLKAMVGLAPETKIEVEIDDFYVKPQSIVLDLRYGEETKTIKGTYKDLKLWYYVQPQAAYRFLNGGTIQQTVVNQPTYTNITTPKNTPNNNITPKNTTPKNTTNNPQKVVTNVPEVKGSVNSPGITPKVEPVVPVVRRKSLVVRSKQTLSQICRRYKISREDFRRWNGIEPTSNKVLADQLYYVEPPIIREKYLAQEQDGILSICKKFDIHLSEFLRWNNLEKGDELLVEQAYFISPPVQNALVIEEPQVEKKQIEKPVIKKPTKPQQKRRFIKVRRGNTIGGICLKYKIKSADFRRWNGLSRSAKIYIGKRYWVSAPVDRPAYIAKSGADIASLCKNFEIHLSEFLRWNHLAKDDQLLVGKAYWVSPPKDRVLPVDEPTKFTPKESTPTAIKESTKDKPQKKNPTPKKQLKKEVKRRFIKVRRGDTIGEICLRHKISKADFRRWNNLGRNSKIYAGKRYWISGPVE